MLICPYFSPLFPHSWLHRGFCQPITSVIRERTCAGHPRRSCFHWWWRPLAYHFINTILLWTNNVHKHINLFEIQLNTKGIHEGRPLLRQRCARFSLCVVHRNLNPAKQSRDFILIIRWFEFYDLLTAHVNRFGRFGYDQVTGTLRKRITREQLRPGEQFRNLCPLNW